MRTASIPSPTLTHDDLVGASGRGKFESLELALMYSLEDSLSRKDDVTRSCHQIRPIRSFRNSTASSLQQEPFHPQGRL